MEVRSGFDALTSLLGINAPAPAGAGAAGAAGAGRLPDADRATLSPAASGMAQAAGDGDVRMDKVAAVQAALAQGSYDVPASAVASKLVNAMLGA
ncbi:MAG TPA: flagellar biosynthesis anti-sigma factor FlgM [Terracidiphilus sp.]|jgi:negative regulator of flagellin synthesis FlgM|nr:flagellar biosynthesis anti-sigma factor FlgM [Terracidiphilus sp.]